LIAGTISGFLTAVVGVVGRRPQTPYAGKKRGADIEPDVRATSKIRIGNRGVRGTAQLSTGQVRGRDEITAAIRGFTPAQWGRLKKVAGRYAQKAAMPSEVLLQEAFARA